MAFAVTIVPYRESWPDDFAAEAARLRTALGPACVRLHHIGSTAVPGLAAKPIIDVLVEAESLAALDARGGEMEKLGYEVMGEFGLPERRYFRKDDAAGVRTHQVHAWLAGSPELARHLAFRDYLRKHPEVAREYGALKGRLVAASRDLEAYIAGKDAFVKEVERRALAWAGRG